jgi:predicted nuclease with TOPRIM domain
MSINDEKLTILYNDLQRGINNIQEFLVKARARRTELITNGNLNGEFKAYDTGIKNIENELAKFIEQLVKLKEDKITTK